MKLWDLNLRKGGWINVYWCTLKLGLVKHLDLLKILNAEQTDTAISIEDLKPGHRDEKLTCYPLKDSPQNLPTLIKEAILTWRNSPRRGSTIRTLRSLHETTSLAPSQLHDALSGMSGNSISLSISPVPTFQMKILLSDPIENTQHKSMTTQINDNTNQWHHNDWQNKTVTTQISDTTNQDNTNQWQHI